MPIVMCVGPFIWRTMRAASLLASLALLGSAVAIDTVKTLHVEKYLGRWYQTYR